MQQDRRIPQRRVHKFVGIGAQLAGTAITRPSTFWPRCAMFRRICEVSGYFSLLCHQAWYGDILGYYVTRRGTASKHEVSRKESFVLTGNSFEEEIQS